MSSSKIERKLAAIMFTDIVGYTALSAKDSTKSLELLKTQRELLKPIVEKHGGSWMKEMGDGLLLTFDSATSAVECSIAIQKSTKEIDGLNLRIGIHEGEVIKQDGDVLGDDVNVAARIEPFSAEGGVAISQKVQQAISSNKEFKTKYIGMPKLKGVTQEVKVYCITSHRLPSTDISKVSAKLEEKSKFNIFTLTGGVLAFLGIVFWIGVGILGISFGDDMEIPSVGILMMENLGKEDEEFWSRGLTADLITRVAGAGLIRISSIEEIIKLDNELTIEEKAKKLGVKYILTHSFLIKNNSFDLWFKLVDIENGVALFSDKISEEMDVTTQLVGLVASKILTSLKVESKQKIIQTPTSNIKAYEFYLRGKHIHDNRENMEDVKISQELLRKAISLDENLLEAKITLGWTYSEKGEYDRAIEIYMPIIDQAKKLDNKRMLAYNLLGIGIVYNFKGENNKAMEYYNRSLIILQKIGDKSGLAFCYANIGIIYNDNDNLDLALDYYNKSLEIQELLGNKRGIGKRFDNIGNIYFDKGNYDKANELYEKSFEIAKEVGDKIGMGFSIVNIGNVYFNKGKYDKALEIYTQIAEKARVLGDKYGIAYSLTKIGNVYFVKNEYNIALDYYKKSLLIQKEMERSESALIFHTTIYLNLCYKYVKYEYSSNEIYNLMKINKNIGFELNYRLYQFFANISYLETAQNQVQEKIDVMEEELANKFLSYPIPKAIVEEWEEVSKVKN